MIKLAVTRADDIIGTHNIRQTRQLLQQAEYTIQPTRHQLATLNDLHSLATAEGITIPTDIKTAC
jgi:hypothetical protein